MANPVVSNVNISRADWVAETITLQLDYEYVGDYPEQGSSIQWYKNGERQSVLDDRSWISHRSLATGDIWYVTVRPRDNHGQWGNWAASGAVEVIPGPVTFYRVPGVYPHKIEEGGPGPAPVPSPSSSSSSTSSFSSSFSSSSSSSLSSSSVSSCSSSSFSSSSSCSSSFSSSSSSFSSSCSSSCSSSFSSSSGLSLSSSSSSTIGPPSSVYNDVVIDGNYMYCACQSYSYGHGVMIFDVSDRANPFRVGYAIVSVGIPKRIRKSGNVVYVTAVDGFASIDVTTPSNPTELDTLALWSSSGNTLALALNGSRAYVNSISDGLKIINISSPSSMSLVTTWTETWQDLVVANSSSCGFYTNWLFTGRCPATDPTSTKGSWGWHAYDGGRDVRVDASYIYVDNGAYVWRLNKSDTPSHDRLWGVNKCPTDNGLTRSFEVDSGSIYVHEGGCSPQSSYNYQDLNTSDNDIDNRVQLTSGDAALTYPKARAQNNYVYFLRSGGLSIVSLSSHTEVNAVTIASRGLDTDASYLYICVFQTGNHRVEIYDISDPTNLLLVGTGY